MDSGAIVVEISSDDEGCGGNNSDISISSWTTDSDEHVGREVIERDGVKVECEVSSSTICNEDSSSMSMRKGDSCNDSDDDCIIVENKPDSTLAVGNDCEGGAEVDELFIVRETGELACRDYPHPRYLCAKFPFSMTPHLKHCTMCHCYVCDIPAPCNYWIAGDPIAGHCHATHKDKIWRAERIVIREKKKKLVDFNHVAKLSDNARRPDWLNTFVYRGSKSVVRSVRHPTLLPDNTKTNPCNPGLSCSFGRQIQQPCPAPDGPKPLQMRAVSGSSLNAQSMQSFPDLRDLPPKEKQ